MKRSSVSVVIYLALVFASGLAVGWAGYGFYNLRSVGAKGNPCSPDAVRGRYISELRTRLKLRPEQADQVSTIVQETGRRFHSLREKYRPEVVAIQDQQATQIRAILDEGQRAEYEKMRQEREHQRH
jgi:hypothetical protein